MVCRNKMRTSIIDIFIFIDISRLKYMIWTVLKNGYEPFLKLFQSHFCQTIQRLDDKVLLRPRFRRLYEPWMNLWLYSLWYIVNAFVFVVDLRERILKRECFKTCSQQWYHNLLWNIDHLFIFSVRNVCIIHSLEKYSQNSVKHLLRLLNVIYYLICVMMNNQNSPRFHWQLTTYT